MAPILNTQSTTGLPLCLSGITHPVALSKEMADHDRRRKGLKKSRLRLEKLLHAVASADQDDSYFFGATVQRIQQDLQGLSEEVSGDVAGDLAAVALLLQQLSCISLSSCTAKAA
ncbi:OLC1v1004019C1 [Oldenlandia corymbosa var. corymbosa]|uniref:OLC1v1004019C1 n=1 Tax=Oldenlandia corymbosa var. corymbosa TaxID=529605 RepID=A0AAV1DDP9_OLDCO|nr:OLC1v1004019C1 [Oldenlandia corymbosa var. corymbosa]